MSTTPPPAEPLALPQGVVIQRVEGRQRLAAARRLLSAGGRDDGPDAARRMLEAAQRHGIDLTNLWATLAAGAIRHVCLAVPGAGRSAMLFTSAPASPREQDELAALVDHACAHLPGVVLAQALLEPHEQAARAALLRAGFTGVGTLAYMQRPVPAPGELRPPESWPEGVAVRRYRGTEDDEPVRLAMERSYEKTLDCPELCGLRDTRDIFESHRATGRWDPNLWWLVTMRDRPEGVLMLNPCPEQDAVELVYIGISPPLRARAVGDGLLRLGLSAVAGRRERCVSCAVDERNAPALRLYGRFGFSCVARRVAVVRPLRTGASNARIP